MTDVRNITVRSGQNSAAGSVVGSVVGGFVGSTVGSGHGRTVATIVGATAGGMAGQHAGMSHSGTSVTRLSVRFENGDVHTYDIDPDEAFLVGDPVKIIAHGGKVRVTR